MLSSFPAYTGNQPYAFVSYAHSDSARVHSIISTLYQNGYRIWYDGGIEQTQRFARTIAERINGCSVFMLFVSRNSMLSDNVLDELNLAKSKKKKIMPIRLDDTPLSDELQLLIGSLEQMFVGNCSDYQCLSLIQQTLVSCYGRNSNAAYITFGAYPSMTNTASPLEWQIIARQQNFVMLITKNIIDTVQFSTDKDVMWSTSYLRFWLNNDFFNIAFAPQQATMIPCAQILNQKNNMFGWTEDEVTSDRVFCLSIQEAMALFKSDNERQSVPTEYAYSRGVKTGNYSIAGAKWWLRSPGSASCAACVIETGFVNQYGCLQKEIGIGVRPVIYLPASAVLSGM